MRPAPRLVPSALMFVGLVFVLLMSACSGDDGPATPDRDPAYTAAEVESMIVQPQTDRKALLDGLMDGGMTQTAAVDSVLQVFPRRPRRVHGRGRLLRASACSTPTAWSAASYGTPGTTPRRPAPSSSAPRPRRPPRSTRRPPRRPSFLNSHYSDRTAHADPIRDTYGALLEDAGYGVLNVFLDDRVTLERYTQLGGHRIVHIYSHGAAWPTSDDIQEVYLMSGETFSQGHLRYLLGGRGGREPGANPLGRRRQQVSSSARSSSAGTTTSATTR